MQSTNTTEQEIFKLIEAITPRNNEYRDLIKNDRSGAEIIRLMWEVGAMLEEFIGKHSIKPHKLYWKIYGKSDGIRSSYITRDFLSYCLRIKKYFNDEDSINIQFPTLQKYSLFREALPLLENPKFKLPEAEEQQLLKILNSTNSPTDIRKFIKKVKGVRIGIKNTRTQKLSEVKPIADSFVIIYNQIYSIIKSNDRDRVAELMNSFGKEYFIIISEGVSALTQEGLYVPKIIAKPDLSKEWVIFIDNLRNLLDESVETRNRFRRIFPPRKLFEFADMLNSFISENAIDDYRKKKGIK